MPKRPADAPRNRFLAGLPKAEYRRILPFLPPTRLAANRVAYEPHGAIEYVFFPGDAGEVATFGNEGLVGHCSFGGRTPPHRVVVQDGHWAQRIASGDLQGQDTKDGPLKHLLAAYHVARMAQVSQSVTCNGLHRLGQRWCRWLLMTCDRVASDNLRLTPEHLAMMPGTRRVWSAPTRAGSPTSTGRV